MARTRGRADRPMTTAHAVRATRAASSAAASELSLPLPSPTAPEPCQPPPLVGCATSSTPMNAALVVAPSRTPHGSPRNAAASSAVKMGPVKLITTASFSGFTLGFVRRVFAIRSHCNYIAASRQ